MQTLRMGKTAVPEWRIKIEEVKINEKFQASDLDWIDLQLKSMSHWTYFMQILSNHNTQSLYHFENSVIVALKSDIFTFYICQINKGDIWLQFEKLKKNRQMALSYRNSKNKY